MCIENKLLYDIKTYTYSSENAPSNATQHYKKTNEDLDLPTFFSSFFVGISILFSVDTNEPIGTGSITSNPWYIIDKSADPPNVTKYHQSSQSITLNATSSRPLIKIPLFNIVSPTLTKTQTIYTQDIHGLLTIINVINDVPNQSGYERQDIYIKIYDLPFYTPPCHCLLNDVVTSPKKNDT